MAAIAHIGVFLRHAAKRDGDGWRVNPPRERQHGGGSLFGVTEEPDLGLVRSKVTPQPLTTFVQPIRIAHQDAVDAIPHTFIECTDRGMFVSFMRHAVGGRMPPNGPGWNRRTIPCGHDAMIIAPRALAEMLFDVAQET